VNSVVVVITSDRILLDCWDRIMFDKLTWKVIGASNQPNKHYGPRKGLFRNGILVASYQRERGTFHVFKHVNGRLSTDMLEEFLVLDQKIAREKCKEVATNPTFTKVEDVREK
jgi:hypothetical protein